MALPTFVRDQMLGLDDAARLREALRTGDWWQVTKSSAAIAVELGGTVSLVGFPIAAGIGALNRRLGGAAVAAATPPVPPVPPRPALPSPRPMPALTATASPSSAGPFGTNVPVSPIPLGPGPIPLGPGPRPVIPVRRPGLAPGAGLASLTARTAAPDLGSLVRPTVPVPPRPFVQQAFPTVSPQPAAAVTRPTTPPSSGILYDEFGNLRNLDGGVSVDDLILRQQAEEAAGLPRRSPQEIEADILAERAAQRASFVPEFPMTNRPTLAEVVRAPKRQPGMNPAARGVRPPAPLPTSGSAALSAELRTPPFVSARVPSGGATDVPGGDPLGRLGGRPQFRPPRNVPGAPRGPVAPRRPEDQQALELAGRIQRGEAADMIASARGNAPVPAREDLPGVDVPEFVVINLDEAIKQRLVSARLLRDSGIRTQRVDQFGNKIDAPMSVDEYFSLPKADQEEIGIILEARRKGPRWIEYRRGRQRGVTEPSRPQGMVAQEKYFDIDPATGKPKTSRMPGTYHGPPGDLERELDQAIARMEPFQYSTGAAGSGERTGRMVWEAAGGDTKMLRNARLQALDVPPWKYVVDDAGNTVYRDGFPLVEESYWKNIPGIEKALKNASPEQAQWIKTFGARRWHQINSEPNVQVLSMLKHRTVGGFNGRGYDPTSGIIAVPRTTKASLENLDRLRISPEQIGVGEASTRAGVANYDLLDFSEANMLDDGLINEEFAELFMNTFRERFRTLEGLVIPRWGVDEAGAQVRVGWRRPTPEERMNLRIARGAKPKKIEGQGVRTGTTLEEMGYLD